MNGASAVTIGYIYNTDTLSYIEQRLDFAWFDQCDLSFEIFFCFYFSFRFMYVSVSFQFSKMTQFQLQFQFYASFFSFSSYFIDNTNKINSV